MTIVAFMESPSKSVFPEGTTPIVIARYRDDQEYHRRMLRQSMSGNRLYQAFSDMFDKIHWDNVAPGGSPSTFHVDQVIKEHDPILILTFGEIAKNTVRDSLSTMRTRVMSCHHPNARFKTQSDLDQFAADVRAWYDNWSKNRSITEEEEPEQFE